MPRPIKGTQRAPPPSQKTIGRLRSIIADRCIAARGISDLTSFLPSGAASRPDFFSLVVLRYLVGSFCRVISWRYGQRNRARERERKRTRGIKREREVKYRPEQNPSATHNARDGDTLRSTPRHTPRSRWSRYRRDTICCRQKFHPRVKS